MTSKAAALRDANLYTAISGGVMAPHDENDPDGPYTVIHCADDKAPGLARRMRVTRALQLLGYDLDRAEAAVDWCADRDARRMLDEALRRLA